jgi:hypothetical protein
VDSFGSGDEYSVSVASSAADRCRCWRLVYEVYRRKEYAGHDPARLWYSIFDALPETVTLMVERQGELVGSVTVIPDSPLGLPVDATFPAESFALRLAGQRAAEVCGLVQSAPSERSGVRVVRRLCELAVLVAGRALECSDMLITVNPRHEGFYTKLMLFERRGRVVDCDRVSGAPAVCLHLNLAEAGRHVERAKLPGAPANLYRRFMPADRARGIAERIRRAVRPMDEASLRRYFVEDRPLIPSAPRNARHYLEERYSFYDLIPESSDTREYVPV